MRVCSYTYVIEGVPDAYFDYDGSPLLRCSRCRLIYYKDKAAQKAHYSFHQHSCKLIASSPSSFPSSNDNATIAAKYPNLDACFSVLKDNLANCPDLAVVLFRIRQLMDEDPGEAFNMGMSMHSWARGVIFYPGNFLAAVMGRPCMAKLMLCSVDDDSETESDTERMFTEDLLSDKARVLKELSNYGHGRPSEEFIRRIADPEEKKRVERLCRQYDGFDNTDESGDPSSMSYCYLYFSLLVAAAVRARSTNFSFHDGNGSIRGNFYIGPDSVAEYHLAIAALRRAMSLWSNLDVLDSCGDAMAPAAALAITGLRHCIAKRTLGGVACREDEIIPGLAADAAVKACLCEILREAISARYAAELLELLADLAQRPSSFWELVERPSLWRGLSVARRASCALAIVRFVSDAENEGGDGDDDSFNANFGQKIDSLPFNECNVLFRAVTAMAEEDSNLTKAVLDLASAHGDYIGPVGAGRNLKGVAFFYYLSRGEKYYVEDLVGAIEQFDALPKSDQAEDDDELAMAKAKEECLKLARSNIDD
mmetsp:Transcript_21429/g.61426  ORF Transcript_21429/g.61426 Transcript_21429/m.61426 type:complete len:538 (+) Transcript_21429:1316-2929(+)